MIFPPRVSPSDARGRLSWGYTGGEIVKTFISEGRGIWCTRAKMAYTVVAVASVAAVWPASQASAQWHPASGPHQPPIQSGLAFTWGNNGTGELGQGNDKDSPVPLAIPKLNWPISAISTGTDGSLALSRRGTGLVLGRE